MCSSLFVIFTSLKILILCRGRGWVEVCCEVTVWTSQPLGGLNSSFNLHWILGWGGLLSRQTYLFPKFRLRRRYLHYSGQLIEYKEIFIQPAISPPPPPSSTACLRWPNLKTTKLTIPTWIHSWPMTSRTIETFCNNITKWIFLIPIYLYIFLIFKYRVYLVSFCLLSVGYLFDFSFDVFCG